MASGMDVRTRISYERHRRLAYRMFGWVFGMIFGATLGVIGTAELLGSWSWITMTLGIIVLVGTMMVGMRNEGAYEALEEQYGKPDDNPAARPYDPT